MRGSSQHGTRRVHERVFAACARAMLTIHRLRSRWIVKHQLGAGREHALVNRRVACGEVDARRGRRRTPVPRGAEDERPQTTGVVARLAQPPVDFGHRCRRERVAPLGPAQHQGHSPARRAARSPGGRSGRRRTSPLPTSGAHRTVPRNGAAMQVHLVDGTYELFRHHFALPARGRGDSRGGRARAACCGSVLEMLERRRDARRRRHRPRHRVVPQRPVAGLQDRRGHRSRAAGAVPAARGGAARRWA